MLNRCLPNGMYWCSLVFVKEYEWLRTLDKNDGEGKAMFVMYVEHRLQMMLSFAINEVQK